MKSILNNAGIVLGLVGLLVCAAMGVVRLAGNHHFLGHEVIVLFEAGVALMVAGCLARLYALERGR